MRLEEQALATYESLRTSVLLGQVRGPGLAALRFHGMLHGLVIVSRSAPPPASPRVSNARICPIDGQLVRLLANLVLRTQSELMHVY